MHDKGRAVAPVRVASPRLVWLAGGDDESGVERHGENHRQADEKLT